MTEIENLLDWATSKGVALNGIAPKVLLGRGIGIVATRALKSNEVVLSVPANILRTLENTPSYITTALKGATTHAILATSLCLETSPSFEPWRAVCPSQKDISSSLPLCWPSELQALLPAKAKTLLAKQQAKFDSDWALVSQAALPETTQLTESDFRYAWLLVNTRTFYHTTPATKKLTRENHMALQPVADLFNHSPAGCTVAYDSNGFTFTTVADIEAGEEVFIRYGTHTNDFLLVEYGFCLPAALNHWDETSLDAHICPRFSAAQRAVLEDAGFWGGYMLDADTVCYRTQTALRLLCVGETRWRAVLEGRRDEDADQQAVDQELKMVLQRYDVEISGVLGDMESVETDDDKAMTSILKSRWIQIEKLVETAMTRLQG